LPPFGHPLPTASTEIINTALAKTGSPNVVAAILLDFRVYDTLGILAVIFCAVLGVQAVLRKKGRKALNERDVFDS
jgi:multicomponent Na+:H+ antiporter subunit A